MLIITRKERLTWVNLPECVRLIENASEDSILWWLEVAFRFYGVHFNLFAE